jgi:hypothetical protein
MDASIAGEIYTPCLSEAAAHKVGPSSSRIFGSTAARRRPEPTHPCRRQRQRQRACAAPVLLAVHSRGGACSTPSVGVRREAITPTRVTTAATTNAISRACAAANGGSASRSSAPSRRTRSRSDGCSVGERLHLGGGLGSSLSPKGLGWLESCSKSPRGLSRSLEPTRAHPQHNPRLRECGSARCDAIWRHLVWSRRETGRDSVSERIARLSVGEQWAGGFRDPGFTGGSTRVAAGGGGSMCRLGAQSMGVTCTDASATRTASYPALAGGCLVRGGRHVAAEQHAGDHPAVRLALLGRRDPVT